MLNLSFSTLGAAAGAGLIVLAAGRTRGVPRYLLGLAGIEMLRRAGRNIWCNRQSVSRQQEVVDVSSEQSFPASDPPSWTAG